MNPRLQSILKYLLFLGIGAVLFYNAFKNTDIHKLAQDFQHANYWYILASMIMGFLAFISRGMRWKLLLEPLGKAPKTWHGIHAVSIGYLSNLLVPRAGELARCTALNRSDDIPVNRLFGTVILERVVDFIMLLLLVILTFILKFDDLMSFFSTSFAQDSDEGGLSTMIKVSIALVILASFVVLYIMRQRFSHLPGYHKVRDFWYGVKDGIKSISKLHSVWPFILHTVFIWSMYYLMVYICFFALPVTSGLSATDGLLIFIVAGLGMVVPTPGGIGAYHYLVMLGLGVFGIANDDGVSFATLVHTGQMVMTIIAGMIGFTVLARARALNKKMESEEEKLEVQKPV